MDYLEHLSTKTHPTHARRRGLLQIPSAKVFHLAGSKKRAFSTVAHTLWNILPPEVRFASTLLAIQKSLCQLCQLAWSLKGDTHYAGADWMKDKSPISYHPCFWFSPFIYWNVISLNYNAFNVFIFMFSYSCKLPRATQDSETGSM